VNASEERPEQRAVFPLRSRDVFVAPSQERAERRLKECGELLEDFAERVYAYGGER
jgi:hypothetical protein